MDRPDWIVASRRTLLVGYCLNVLLYGILTVQTYLYYVAFPNDKKITKAIVAFVYSIDTVQTILALYDFYLLFCIPSNDHFVLELELAQVGFMWLTIPLSGTLVATVAQLFYAHRIYTLSKKKIVTSIVIVLALSQLVFGIGTTMFLLDIFSIFSVVSLYGWGPVGMICDLVIAIYMSWFLTKQMRRSSRTTLVMVTRIKRLVLETGFLAAMFASAFTLFLIFVGSQVYPIPGLTLGKIYSNFMLVLLNNHFTIAGGRNEPTFEFEADSYHLSDLPRKESAHGIRE